MRGLPEKESTIASVAVLLEPNEDNLYYGQNLWYDPSGFLTVGPWTLVPNSFVVTQPLWIPQRQERLLSREYIQRWFFSNFIHRMEAIFRLCKTVPQKMRLVSRIVYASFICSDNHDCKKYCNVKVAFGSDSALCVRQVFIQIAVSAQMRPLHGGLND